MYRHGMVTPTRGLSLYHGRNMFKRLALNQTVHK